MTSPRADAPTAVFMHVATMGRYGLVFNEVLSAVERSGLLERCDFVEINVLGTGDMDVANPHPKIRVLRRSDDVGQFEQPTLASIQSYCQANPTARVLYLNCLGGRYVGDGWNIRSEWRQMLYHLFLERNEHCLDLLRRFDVVSVDWAEKPLPHATSNNWWATAAFIASLPSPGRAVELTEQGDYSAFSSYWADVAVRRRHAGEFWLGMHPAVRPYRCLDMAGYGLPKSDLGAVPWWILPGVPWSLLARRATGDRSFGVADIRFRLFVLRLRIRGLQGRVRYRWQRLKTGARNH